MCLPVDFFVLGILTVLNPGLQISYALGSIWLLCVALQGYIVYSVKNKLKKEYLGTPIGENEGVEIVRCPGVWIHKEQIPLMHSHNAAVLFIRILLLVCGKHFWCGVGSVFAHMNCWTELLWGIYRSLTPSECLRLPSLVILHLISSWTRPIKMSWNLNSLLWKLVLPSPMQQ